MLNVLRAIKRYQVQKYNLVPLTKLTFSLVWECNEPTLLRSLCETKCSDHFPSLNPKDQSIYLPYKLEQYLLNIELNLREESLYQGLDHRIMYCEKYLSSQLDRAD